MREFFPERLDHAEIRHMCGVAKQTVNYFSLLSKGAEIPIHEITQHNPQYFHQQAPTLGHRVVILAAIVVTCSLAYVILEHAVQVIAFLGQTGLRFLSRLLGLLLAVIAVQFILQGVEETVIGLVHQLR